WWWLLEPVLLVLFGSVALTAGLRWIDPPTTAFMLAALIEALARGDLHYRNVQHWVPMARVSPWAGVAVIAAEDQKVPDHHGFDVAAMQDAWSAHRDGGRLRGASTISQQLAKNLYLWSGRSWLRKGLEAWFTVLLETVLPKARILELYLNVAEFGH